MKSISHAVNQSVTLLPIITLVLIGVSKIFLRKILPDRLPVRITVEVAVAILAQFYILHEPSIIPWWSLVTKIMSRLLSKIASKESMSNTPQTPSFRAALLNGPLGPGASKVVEVIVAILLWRFLNEAWPKIQLFGNSRKFPSLAEWMLLLGISVAVNAVLYTWSRISNSTGTHDGVDRMVSSSKDQNRLTPRERLLYGSLALLNATCEEVSFRWFWRSEFAVYISDEHSNRLRPGDFFGFDSNVAQAAIFGIFHYYGIPSGLAGVGLTFVYGWIMGSLMDYVGDGGLFLPIVAHTIADFYIFSSIARGKAAKVK